METRVFTILQLFVLIFCDFVTSKIKCPQDFSRMLCTPPKFLKILCGDAGTVYGPCQHCQICAKGKGQSCGGEMLAHGKCGHGLFCSEIPGEVGQCHAKTTPKRLLQHGEKDFVFKCRPKCTFEFCSMYPKEICSAADNGIINRECQGTCQHTQCQACYFKTKRESPCPNCAKDDFVCMERFGKCVRHETCTKHKYPCHSNHRRAVDGKFVCKIPACA